MRTRTKREVMRMKARVRKNELHSEMETLSLDGFSAVSMFEYNIKRHSTMSMRENDS